MRNLKKKTIELNGIKDKLKHEPMDIHDDEHERDQWSESEKLSLVVYLRISMFFKKDII